VNPEDNFLTPELIKDWVQAVNGTIVECNTAYPGKRANTEDSKKSAADHGFTDGAAVDIMVKKVQSPTVCKSVNRKKILWDPTFRITTHLLSSRIQRSYEGGFAVQQNMSIVLHRQAVKCDSHAG
jgi:hypothetical protein